MSLEILDKIKGDISFEEYALLNARETDYLAYMSREEDQTNLSKKPLDELYASELANAKANLDKFKKMTSEEYMGETLNNRKVRIIEVNQEIEDKAKLRNNYMRLMMDAKAWRPPTDNHAPLKKKMVNQLESAIQFDCDDTFNLQELEDLNAPFNINELFAAQLDKIENEVKYYEDKVSKDAELAGVCNEWVDKLVFSLRMTPEQRKDLLNFD